MTAILVFALAMMIKGGWLGRIPGWNTFTKKKRSHWELHNAVEAVKAWLLDGTQLSAFLVFSFMATQLGIPLSALFGLCWWIIIMRSMGEEAGAVGDYRGGWGVFVETAGAGRLLGIEAAVGHGAIGGFLMSIITGYNGFIFAFAAFPVCYFIGNSIHQFLHKTTGWAYSEILYGAVIGLAVHFYLGGV